MSEWRPVILGDYWYPDEEHALAVFLDGLDEPMNHTKEIIAFVRALPDPPKEVKSEYGKSPNNFHITRRGDTLLVTLTYPPWSETDNTNGQCFYIEIDQESVRASDGIRMFYDYERDGWAIQQAAIFEWACDDEDMDRDWQEVAFIQSWAREKLDSDDKQVDHEQNR